MSAQPRPSPAPSGERWCGHRVDVLEAWNGSGSPPGWVRDLLDAVARDRTPFADLESAPVAAGDVATLERLAEHTGEAGYRLSLRLRLHPHLDRARVLRLQRAGMVRAKLAAVRLGEDVAATLLPVLRLLRYLAEARVEVEWDLHAEPDSEDPGGQALAGLLPSIVHLPPPRAVAGTAAVIDRWRDGWRRDSLTFSHGPGFVRIVDRRRGPQGAQSADVSRERVLVLHGLQYELFLALEEPSRRREMEARFQERLEPGPLGRWLDQMVEHRLVIEDGADRLLALPFRRKIVGVG